MYTACYNSIQYLQDEYGANFRTLECPQKVDAMRIIVHALSLYPVPLTDTLTAWVHSREQNALIVKSGVPGGMIR